MKSMHFKNLKNDNIRHPKVIIISDRIYPYFKGGAEKRYWEIASNLVRLGWEVKFITGQWPNMERQEEINGISLQGTYKVGDFYVNGHKSISETIKYTFSIIKPLLFEDFDIIECEQFPLLPIIVCKLFSLIRQKPLVVTWHEVWGISLWNKYIGLLGLVGSLIERICVHLPCILISVSCHTTQKLSDLYAVPFGKINTIPNGINPKWDRRGKNQCVNAKVIKESLNYVCENRVPVESSDIIYVGRLLDHKKVDLLIKVVKLIKDDYSKVQCLIVGDGPEYEQLLDLSKELGLEDNVHFLGFIENEKRVYSYMKNSKVFILPSIREGFGISVIEANSCGLPVLVIQHEDNAACDLIINVNSG